MKTQLKLPDGAGGFNLIHPETDAEVVEYGASNVADFLDGLPAMNASNFMKRLLTAANEFEARKMLQVGREDIFDEAGTRWLNAYTVTASTAQKKFGTKSLYTSGSYLKHPGVTLGGQDFTIAGWFYIPATTAAQCPWCWGNSTNRLFLVRNKSTAYLQLNYSPNDAARFALNTSTAFAGDTWVHLELDYKNSTNTFYLFMDGTKLVEQADTDFATPRTYPFYFGVTPKDLTASWPGYIDEFIITNRLLHTANFTVPTAPYDFEPEYTISLLHCGLETLTDETGALWQNHKADLASAQKKFGSRSLYLNNYAFLKHPGLTLGGKDFSISTWVYLPSAPSAAKTLFCWGNFSNRLAIYHTAAGLLCWFDSPNDTFVYNTNSTSTTTLPDSQWFHVEVDYRNSDNKIFLFLDGVKIDEETVPDFANVRTFPLYIGTHPKSTYATLVGYFDEFLVTEKLLHDADFTPPTAPHTLDNKTLSLFHFE